MFITRNLKLFADDCFVYRAIRSIKDVELLQDDLDRLVAWGDKWQMKFNLTKCSTMNLTHKTNKKANIYTMKGTQLTQVTNHVYLGIDFQDNLRWDRHINKIVKSASKTQGMIRRNLWGCSQQTKSLAYMALVRPHV